MQNVNGLQEIEFSYPHDVVFAHLMRVLNRSRFKVQDHDDRMHWVYAYAPRPLFPPASGGRTAKLGARVKPRGNDASVLIIETGPSVEGGFPRDPEFHKRSVRGLIRKLQKSLKGQAAST